MPRTLALAQAGAAAVVLARLARGRRRRPPLSAAGSPPPAAGISVVVPARDEAERLPACLAGLRADPDVAETVVVDDESRDATAEVARAGGARVVAGTPSPPGWRGKTWALEQGLRAARGPLVVFLDADARPAPGLACALAGALADADLVSGAPRFRLADPAARALHASMLATIVLRVGPTDVPGWQPSPGRAIANGQCLAARRADLLAAGGWGRVRGALTEDVALARALRADGRRLAFVDVADLLEVEPYATLRETWEGWGRSLLGVDVTPPARVGEDLTLLWLAMGLPLPRLLLRRAGPLDALLLLVRLALQPALARSYRPRGAAFWLAPLLDPATLVRLTGSALRRERTWRGRTYAARRAPRSGP